jgi:hypothetical protein
MSIQKYSMLQHESLQASSNKSKSSHQKKNLNYTKWENVGYLFMMTKKEQ